MSNRELLIAHTDHSLSAQFHSHENLHPFLWAGNSTVTIVSKLTGKRFTYNIKKASFKPDVFFVNVLSGPDGQYTYVGMCNITDQDFYLTKGSKVSKDAPSYVAFNWFFYMLSNPENMFKHTEVWHEGKCGRCGRQLTVPSSIELGIGPDCLAKMEGGE